jgi:hypothetical protein
MPDAAISAIKQTERENEWKPIILRYRKTSITTPTLLLRDSSIVASLPERGLYRLLIY